MNSSWASGALSILLAGLGPVELGVAAAICKQVVSTEPRPTTSQVRRMSDRACLTSICGAKSPLSDAEAAGLLAFLLLVFSDMSNLMLQGRY